MTQHIIRVQAENFRKLKVLDFQPNRYITKVSGANGAGKTSALDAILCALDKRKTVDAKELRAGERRGGIRIETNTHIITRRMDENGGTLTIEAKDSKTLVKEPVDWLAAIAGNLGFDPLAFMRMTGEQQAEKLKGIVQLDADVDELEEKNDADSQLITSRKAEMKRMIAARDSITVDPNIPREPIDIDALLKESQAIEASNREIERQQREREDKRRRGEECERIARAKDKEIEELRERIKRLTIESREADNEASDLLGELERAEPLAELKDRSAIANRISEASTTNLQVSSNKAAREQYDRMTTEIDSLETEVNNLKAIVSDRKQTAAKALENAQFPIPGLSFLWQTEGSNGQRLKHPKRIVTYHGLPLEDASTGEQIRVSAAIGMAGKPELRFLLIREGSLLDDAGMEILEKMAAENDWQVLIEMVDTSGKVGVYLEDGEIKAVNQEPEPQPAAPAKKVRSKAKQSKMKYGDEAI